MINYDIERIVNGIIEKTKISKVPVDIETICLNYDISLEPLDADDTLSGFFLVNDNRKKIIGYNKTHSENRVRFTIAHELGHFQLHCKKDKNFFIDKSSKFFRNELSSSGILKQEREANAFAAALLMPINILEKELDKIDNKGDSNEIISKLSKKFKVSEDSMKFRLINLGIIDPN